MAESAWLTRSLEQPHVYDQDYPGNIRNTTLKKAFLDTLQWLEEKPHTAPDLLLSALMFLWQQDRANQDLLQRPEQTIRVSIRHIVAAVQTHIEYSYPKGITGAARLPVVAIYAIYRLMLPEVELYQNTILAALESHTSADSKSKSFGDIEVLHQGVAFEAVEIKHNKPISPDLVVAVYNKIKKL